MSVTSNCSGSLTFERLARPLQGGEHLRGQQGVVLPGQEDELVVVLQTVGGDVRQRHDASDQRLSELGGVWRTRLQTVGPQQVSESATLKEALSEAEQVGPTCAGSVEGRQVTEGGGCDGLTSRVSSHISCLLPQNPVSVVNAVKVIVPPQWLKHGIGHLFISINLTLTAPELPDSLHQHQQRLLRRTREEQAVPEVCALSCREPVKPVRLHVAHKELEGASVVSSSEICLLM